MWAHYADSHQGYCLQFDLDRLLRHQLGTMEAIGVDYVGTPPELTLGDVIGLVKARQHVALLEKIIGTKSRSWSYEEELRIVTSRRGLHRFDFRALEAVYFGCRSGESLRSDVMSRLKGRRVSYFEMVTDPSTYDLRAMPMKDLFAESEPCIAEFGEVDKRLLEEVAGLPDSDLLWKAIALTRREPNCQNVVYADWASDDPDTAIVHIELLPGFPQTHHIMKFPKTRLRGDR